MKKLTASFAFKPLYAAVLITAATLLASCGGNGDTDSFNNINALQNALDAENRDVIEAGLAKAGFEKQDDSFFIKKSESVEETILLDADENGIDAIIYISSNNDDTPSVKKDFLRSQLEFLSGINPDNMDIESGSSILDTEEYDSFKDFCDAPDTWKDFEDMEKPWAMFSNTYDENNYYGYTYIRDFDKNSLLEKQMIYASTENGRRSVEAAAIILMFQMQ